MKVFSIIYPGMMYCPPRDGIMVSGEITEEAIEQMSPFSEFVNTHDDSCEFWCKYEVYELDDGASARTPLPESEFDEAMRIVYALKYTDISDLKTDSEEYKEESARLSQNLKCARSLYFVLQGKAEETVKDGNAVQLSDAAVEPGCQKFIDTVSGYWDEE